MTKNTLTLILFLWMSYNANAQTSIKGLIRNEKNEVIPDASVRLSPQNKEAKSNKEGVFYFENMKRGIFILSIRHIGYKAYSTLLEVNSQQIDTIPIVLFADEKVLEEITVKEKYSHWKESPLAITQISKAQLENTHASNLIDVLVKNAPGVSAVKTGPNISKPFIRGLGYNRVLTLYDGIRQEGQQWGDEHGIELDASEIEKSEIIKGPASLMYGSDAIAGVIAIEAFTPEKQTLGLYGKSTSEFQSNHSLLGQSINLHQNSKRIFWSINTAWRAAKNYQNSIDQRVYATNFDEKTASALFGIHHTRGISMLKLTWYDNLQAIPDGSRDSLSRRFTQQIYETNKDIVNERPFVNNRTLNSYRMPTLHQHIQHYRIYVKHSQKIGKQKIDFLIAKQGNFRKEYNHPLHPNLAGMNVTLDTWNMTAKTDFSLFKNIESQIGWQAMLQRNKNNRGSDFPIPDYHSKDAGLYFFSKWKNKKWLLSGGIRQDIRHIQWKNMYISTDSKTGFDQISNAKDPQANLGFEAYQKLFVGWSGSVGITYEYHKGIWLKANLGRAYRAPNINEMASNGLDPGAKIIYVGNRNFKPEFSFQKDIGILINRSSFDLEINLFENKIQNYIYQNLTLNNNNEAFIDAQGNRTIAYKQAKAQLFGGEILVRIHPQNTQGWYTESQLTTVYGYNLHFKNKGTNGSYLPLIPPLQWQNTIGKTIQISHNWLYLLNPYIETEWHAAQNRYLGLNQSETYTAGYFLLHAGIQSELKWHQKYPIQLSVHADNIFNKSYQSHLSRLKYFEYYSASPNGKSGIYQMGRNISLKIRFSF